ncbi:hypothetical protein Mithridates_00003 [Acinetobacter phage Mithridates]|nr:hypothetical protein Mithridates_00003 [Acinetobacter phage Mithridates]
MCSLSLGGYFLSIPKVTTNKAKLNEIFLKLNNLKEHTLK